MNKRNFLKSLISSVPVLSFLPFNLLKAKTVPTENQDEWKVNAIINGQLWHFRLKNGSSCGHYLKKENYWMIKVNNNHLMIEHFYGITFIIQEIIAPNDRKENYVSILQLYPNNYPNGISYPVNYAFYPIISLPVHFI